MRIPNTLTPAWLQRHATVIGTAGGCIYYEHPTLGDESPLIIVKNDQVVMSDEWELPEGPSTDDLVAECEAQIEHAKVLTRAFEKDKDALDLLMANSEIPEHADGNYVTIESVLQAVRDFPVEVQKRHGWLNMDEKPDDTEPREIKFVLAVGGPHIEVVLNLCDGENVYDCMLTAHWAGKRIEKQLSGSDRDAFFWLVNKFT